MGDDGPSMNFGGGFGGLGGNLGRSSAKEKNDYHTAQITAQGKIGIGIKAIDKMTDTYNTFGVYKVRIA